MVGISVTYYYIRSCHTSRSVMMSYAPVLWYSYASLCCRWLMPSYVADALFMPSTIGLPESRITFYRIINVSNARRAALIRVQIVLLSPYRQPYRNPGSSSFIVIPRHTVSPGRLLVFRAHLLGVFSFFDKTRYIAMHSDVVAPIQLLCRFGKSPTVGY
jgi:hypothetical protein